MQKKEVLKNGVRLLTIPMKGTQTFTFLVMVATGSRHEIQENSGISHFLEHMFFKGTKKRPTTLAISSALDKIGGEFNAFTSKEYTGYYAKVDGKHALTAIDVISDMLHNSKFESREIEREKGVILEEENMYKNNPMIYIDDVFEECLFGDTPLGRDTIGTRENIKSFIRQDFIDYFKSQYRGKDVVICLAGNFKNNDVAIAKKYASIIREGDKNIAVDFENTQSEPCLKIKIKKTDQINLSVGVKAYSYNHKDYLTLQLLSIILGGPMSSRLFINVRERKGLAYSIHTQADGYRDIGYLTTTVGTSLASVNLAVKTIIDEYKKVKKILVGKDELQKAKDYLNGKLVLTLESSDSIASWYAKQEVLDYKNNLTPEKFLQMINKISAQDIQDIARQIFVNKNLNLAIIGDKIDKDGLEKILKF
ncbi:MAG: pitrilysin family protein [bacterium]|nr:pitrilysin family protein [bacterium]